MALDQTLCSTEPCLRCGGWQRLVLERQREEVIEERLVLACWNGHRSYL